MSYEKNTQQNDDDSFELPGRLIVEETQLTPPHNTGYDKDDNNEDSSVSSNRVTKKNIKGRKRLVVNETIRWFLNDSIVFRVIIIG